MTVYRVHRTPGLSDPSSWNGSRYIENRLGRVAAIFQGRAGGDVSVWGSISSSWYENVAQSLLYNLASTVLKKGVALKRWIQKAYAHSAAHSAIAMGTNDVISKSVSLSASHSEGHRSASFGLIPKVYSAFDRAKKSLSDPLITQFRQNRPQVGFLYGASQIT